MKQPHGLFCCWNITEAYHYISCRCTTQWSDVCIYCGMITTVSLVDIHHHTVTVFLLMMRTLKIYCLNFQMYNTVLLAIVPRLYMAFPGLTCLTIGGLWFFDHFPKVKTQEEALILNKVTFTLSCNVTWSLSSCFKFCLLPASTWNSLRYESIYSCACPPSLLFFWMSNLCSFF